MNDSDLKIEALDTMSKGGQQTGVIPVGCVVTHLPSKISATVSCFRSQFKNKEMAKSMVELAVREFEYQKDLIKNQFNP